MMKFSRKKKKILIWIALIIGIPLVSLIILLILSVTTTPAGITRTADGLQLQARCIIKAPIEKVWELWMTDNGPPPFGGKNMMVLRVDPIPGGRWCFRSIAKGIPAACGRVLSLQEPNRLELSFKACDLTDKPHRVLLEFSTVEQGTKVSMTMDGFESKTSTYGRFKRANALMLAGMRAEIQGEGPGWQYAIYSAVFFDFLGRLIMKFMKESVSCHDDTDYLGDLKVADADTN